MKYVSLVSGMLDRESSLFWRNVSFLQRMHADQLSDSKEIPGNALLTPY